MLNANQKKEIINQLKALIKPLKMAEDKESAAIKFKNNFADKEIKLLINTFINNNI